MAIFDRLFGRHKEEAVLTASRPPAHSPAPATKSFATDSPVAILDDTSHISLQLLFPSDLSLDPFILSKRLLAFHPALNMAMLEIDATSIRNCAPVGRARWGMHTVDFAGHNTPLSSSIVQSCIGSGRIDSALKQHARNHQAHVRLVYTGTNPSPIDKYVALTAVAGTLASTGAIMVLNEHSRASLPIMDILPSHMKGDRQEYLHSLPIHHLYAGFAELDISGQIGVWMRTYGCESLNMSNLAIFVPDRGQRDWVDEVFTRIFAQILKAQRRLEADATLQVGPVCVRFREPNPSEFFLHDDVFVVEAI